LLSILAEGAEGINAFPTYFLLGVVLIMGALFFKLSLVPFHMWAPDVYEGAKPTTVLFLATGVKVVGLFVLFKLFMGPFEAVRFAFEPLLVFVAGVSVIVGALGGVFQDKFQRLLAYSGISHMGFLLAPLVCGPVGIHSLLTYLLIYMPMVVLAFMLLMIFKKRSESSLLYLFELKGLGKTSPLFAFFMAILMFSLAGLPPLGGFLGKLSVLMAVLKEEHFFLAVIMVLSSVVSCFYYLRVIKLMYFDKNGENEVAAQQAWELCFQNRLILCFLVLFILGFAAFGPFIPLPCCSMS
jgi:NADH-quinone oxidoreductase subunit N